MGTSLFLVIESPIKIAFFPKELDDLDDISTISLSNILLLLAFLAASPVPLGDEDWLF